MIDNMRSAATFLSLLFPVLAPSVLLGAEVGGAGVKVEKAAPKIEYKEFDPAKPPATMPKLHSGEDAVCLYGFEIATDTRCTYSPPKERTDPVSVTIHVTAVDVSLGLKVIVWLPKGVDQRLKDHEDGHRAIAERFYAGAEKVARSVAAKWVGQNVPGKGKDAKAATKAALDVVNNKTCDEILRRLNEPCRTAQDAFDRITDHGRNERPEVKEAIDKAVEEGMKEMEKEKDKENNEKPAAQTR
jgi:hypothetical protein